tara:strand:+ start:665 stop:829 length:165 start_codon:yes stop_codon:yes gene_type:complete
MLLPRWYRGWLLRRGMVWFVLQASTGLPTRLLWGRRIYPGRFGQQVGIRRGADQ